MEKMLYILRHAKTERAAPGQDDFDRALTGRGGNDTHTLGKYMARKGIEPGKVVCSTAVRARQTWEGVAETYGRKVPVEYTDDLYNALVSDVLAVIAKTPQSLSSLLIVGHNPTFHELSVKLAKTGDGTMLNRLAEELPTCALVMLAFDGAWTGIAQAKPALKGFVVPKELPDSL